MKTKHFSKWIILVIILICAWYGRNLDAWGKNKIIQNDVVSYYAYLPAFVIFNDLSFDFMQDLPADFEGTIWLQTAPNGKPILRMTMGLAILWLPFFLMAHVTALLTGASSLGYSWPYSFSIFVAALFYLFTGLYFLRKMLRKYVSDFIAAITLLLIVFATNMMHYVISEPGMPHVYNFALITVFLFLSIDWIERPTIKMTVVLGLLAGLIVLIRPVNILILIFPATAGIHSVQDFLKRLINKRIFILLAGVAAFLVWVPQMVYWKMQTGHFFFNSYMESGKFYFLNPEIVNGLFSYRKGWLIYTPVMIFALAGILLLHRKAKPLFFPVLCFVVLYIYIVYSWWSWWYGGSYGSRPMIDIYGIMAIPLAVFLEKIGYYKKWFRWGIFVILAGFLLLNQFQMTQYRTSLLHWDSMTKEAYWGIFGRSTWPEGYDQMIQVPDYEKALRGEKEYNQ